METVLGKFFLAETRYFAARAGNAADALGFKHGNPQHAYSHSGQRLFVLVGETDAKCGSLRIFYYFGSAPDL